MRLAVAIVPATVLDQRLRRESHDAEAYCVSNGGGRRADTSDELFIIFLRR